MSVEQQDDRQRGRNGADAVHLQVYPMFTTAPPRPWRGRGRAVRSRATSARASAPSSSRRPSTETITSERRSPSDTAVSTAIGAAAPGQRHRACRGAAATPVRRRAPSTMPTARNLFTPYPRRWAAARSPSGGSAVLSSTHDHFPVRHEHAVDGHLQVRTGGLCQRDDRLRLEYRHSRTDICPVPRTTDTSQVTSCSGCIRRAWARRPPP